MKYAKNILRTFPVITSVRAVEGEELTRQWYISDESPDMHRTVIPLDLWDLSYFNKGGAFYYQHITDGNKGDSPNPDLALGPARAFVEGSSLIGEGKFEPIEKNPLAGKIMFKVDYGTMKRTSVGFLPTAKGHFGREAKNEDPELYYFGGQMLTEYSCVHVGSNHNALSKSFGAMDDYLIKEAENNGLKSIASDLKQDVRKRNKKHYIYIMNTNI